MTKRQLGGWLVGLGLLAALAVSAIDLLAPGRAGGFGPGQRAALALAIFVALVGLSLLPLGDDPA